MRVPTLVSDFFEWRWAPCVGLTMGSLSFVALALLCIPTQFDAASASASESSVLDRPTTSAPAPRAVFGASLPRGLPGFGRNSDQASPPPRPTRVEPVVAAESAAVAQRGFSPIVDRPDPPAPPPVVEATSVPGPVPTPAPDPAVIVQQPEADGPKREVTVQ